MKSYIIALFIGILMLGNAWAQSENKFDITVSGGMLDPIDIDQKLGYSMGVKFEAPIAQSNIKLIANTDIFFFKGESFRKNASFIKKGNTFQLPIFMGVKLDKNINPDITVFTSGQIGINFIEISHTETIGDQTGPTTISENHHSQSIYGISLEGGIEFNNRFVVGVKYMKFSSLEKSISNFPLSILNVALGIKL